MSDAATGVRVRQVSWSLWAGLLLSAGFVLVALLAPIWTPHDAQALSIIDKLQGSSLRHWLGTDHLGRDVASMIMLGASSALGVATLAVLGGLLCGVPLGLLAAARGGWVEQWLMRGNDLLFAFPTLLLAILLSAALGAGALVSILAIGLYSVPVFARVTRASAATLWVREFIQAARVAGKGPLRISLEHILPNLRGVLIVQSTLQFSLAIVAEAGLSYVGLGIQAPTPSWGRMLNEAQTLTALAPMLAVYPGLAIALLVLGLNLLGDGLRDWLDPKQGRAA